MIESVHFRDFRGIQRGGIERFRHINLLVGPNNSGKSTVLEGLYLAATVSRPATCTVRYPSGDVAIHDVLVSAPDLLGEHPIKRPWTRHNYAGLPPGLNMWRQGLIRVMQRDPKVPALELYAREQGFAEGEEQLIAVLGVTVSSEIEGQEPVDSFASALWGSSTESFEGKRVVFCWQPELSYYYRGSSAWLLQGTPAVAEHTLFFDADSMQRHIPLGFYQRMLGTVSGWTQRIARAFGSVFKIDRPFDAQFVPTGTGSQHVQGWIAPEDRPALSIDAFGDGARSTFKLLTYLTALTTIAKPDAPGLLLWEEPELYQHPQTLALLLQQVAELVRDRPVQVFISTHSLEVVAQVTMMLQSEQLSEENVRLFRLDLKDGKLISSWFDKENLVAWLESGWDPRTFREFVSPVQFRLRQEGV